MHTPVLLDEVIAFLDPKPGKYIIDGTVGGGGHAEAILRKISPTGKFIGFDWDAEMLRRCKERIHGKRVDLIRANYAEIPEILKKRKMGKADGLLLDLGFSSEQIDPPAGGSGRGFSFNPSSGGEPLIMTYSDEETPVAEILKRISERELEEVISKFGEERFAGRIARAIAARRKIKPIETTGDLAEIIENAAPKFYERGRIHPATRTFQALRIYANDELGNLEKILRELPNILRSGGRAVVISFHSLEDRIVKNTLREFKSQNILKILTKKPVVASAAEIAENPRSRSAKLRAAMIM